MDFDVAVNIREVLAVADDAGLYLFYTDETNVDPANTEFFIYGGVAIPGVEAAGLSAAIDDIRRRYRYKPDDHLKFNTIQRPTHITPNQHRILKRDVMRAAADHKVKFFASLILHNIAIDPKKACRYEINRAAYHFDCFLQRENAHGIAMVDSIPDPSFPTILREKFMVGVDLPYSPNYRLKNVLGFHIAHIGTSNFSSVVDIAIGSLRYAVNARNDPGKKKVACSLLQQLAPMCIRNSRGQLAQISVFFSPKAVKSKSYQDKYRELRTFLETCSLGRVDARYQCGD